MKKNFINVENIEGYVYQHKLTKKTVQNTSSANFGKEFISGSVWVATDEEGLNVVEVHYTFVTPTTKNNTSNKTFEALERIMNGPTWIEKGKTEAMRVVLQPSVAVNDFYNKDGELVSAKRNEGGFITILSPTDELNPDPSKRATFTVDMVITSVKMIEENPEKNIEEHAEIRGCAFDFRNALLPISIKLRNTEGINFMLGLNASPTDPVFMKLWGRIISETTTVEIVEESAFGEPLVHKVPRNHKEFLMTGCNPDSEPFGSDATITAEELKKASQDREVYLASVKKRDEEYQASKMNKGAAAPAPVVNTDGFNF